MAGYDENAKRQFYNRSKYICSDDPVAFAAYDAECNLVLSAKCASRGICRIGGYAGDFRILYISDNQGNRRSMGG